MTAIMIYHIRSKYTAVGEWLLYQSSPFSVLIDCSSGRKEIIMFFYMYAIVELLAIFLDSGIIPTSSPTYPVSPSETRIKLGVRD